MNFKLKIINFILLAIMSASAMEKEQTSYLSQLPQDLKKELIKFISQTKYKNIQEALEIISALQKDPRFTFFLKDQQTANLLIESIAKRLKLYGVKALEVARRLQMIPALTIPATNWLQKREQELRLERELFLAANPNTFDANTIKSVIKKVNINAQDKEGQTALHYVVQPGIEGLDISHVKFLLNIWGIDVNIQDIDGNTPLMLAVSNGSNDIVELLLKAGANVTLKNNEGKTALDIAKERYVEEIIALLEKAAAEKK